MERHQKNLLQKVEAHVETLKTLKDEVASLKKTLCHSLQRTMQFVFEVCDQVLEHAWKFSLGSIILVKALNPFQVAPEVNPKGDMGTSASEAST